MSDPLQPHRLWLTRLFCPCMRFPRQKYWSGLACPSPFLLNVVVQLLSHVRHFVTLWTHARLPSPSLSPGACSTRCLSIKLVMLSNHLILCHPLLLLPSVLPSIKVFSNKSALLIRWPKYWSFSFSINPSNEYSGLISSGLTGLISLQFKGL